MPEFWSRALGHGSRPRNWHVPCQQSVSSRTFSVSACHRFHRWAQTDYAQNVAQRWQKPLHHHQLFHGHFRAFSLNRRDWLFLVQHFHYFVLAGRSFYFDSLQFVFQEVIDLKIIEIAFSLDINSDGNTSLTFLCFYPPEETSDSRWLYSWILSHRTLFR